MALVLLVHCVALWHLADELFSSFVLFVVSMLCLVDPVKHCDHLGPVVQSILSLTSSLVVKMLTVLVNTVSNSQLFLLKKCE